jgi:hypothetical protein
MASSLISPDDDDFQSLTGWTGLPEGHPLDLYTSVEPEAVSDSDMLRLLLIGDEEGEAVSSEVLGYAQATYEGLKTYFEAVAAIPSLEGD